MTLHDWVDESIPATRVTLASFPKDRQLALATAGIRLLRLRSDRTYSARSVSVIPPQMPYGSWTESACSRHCWSTGHVAQTFLALRSRFSRACPRSPSGWKYTAESCPRHAPCSCQSHTSAVGYGIGRCLCMMATSIPYRSEEHTYELQSLIRTSY